jgi:hypothetical protein
MVSFDNGNITVDVVGNTFCVKVETMEYMRYLANMPTSTFNKNDFTWTFPRRKQEAEALKAWTDSVQKKAREASEETREREHKENEKNEEKETKPRARIPVPQKLSEKLAARRSGPTTLTFSSPENSDDESKFKKSMTEMIVKPIHRKSQSRYARETSPRRGRPQKVENGGDEDVEIDNINIATVAKELSDLKRELARLQKGRE